MADMVDFYIAYGEGFFLGLAAGVFLTVLVVSIFLHGGPGGGSDA